MHIEEEILNELRGSYLTSFYSIYLNGKYNEDVINLFIKNMKQLQQDYTK